ncbi:MAG: hypothetical protein ACRYGC_09255 [Janthinobacterium lividum]
MRQASVPPTTPRTWAALAAASVLGTNLGDLVSHTLHLGHLRGLPVLALAFALVLATERSAPRAGQACYWLAIVLLRTAATNLGDLATHDARLPPPAVAALLCAVLALRARAVPNACPDALGRLVPVTDPLYWAAMLTAGTLGTVAGDLLQDTAGQGPALAACAPFLLAAVLAHGALPRPSLATYWATIVMARVAGTVAGDFAADPGGLALGLLLATACSGALLLCVLLFWPHLAPAIRRQASPSFSEEKEAKRLCH